MFSTVDESAAGGLNPDMYELRLIDAEGATAMRFIVPAGIVESVVFSQAEILISMAPDGVIAALPADADMRLSPNNSISVDALVERSVTPKMLEDEPDAIQMLQTLYCRLERAIKLVEKAIVKISK